ncbi:MAG: hypothetical protein WC763_01810 [Candidatus Paceibacterota bacterium]
MTSRRKQVLTERHQDLTRAPFKLKKSQNRRRTSLQVPIFSNRGMNSLTRAFFISFLPKGKSQR